MHWQAHYSLMINRYRFLLAVEEGVPQVIAALRLEVFPFFEALFRRAPSGLPGETGIMVQNESGERETTLWINWRCQIRTVPSWTSEFECEDLELERAAFKEAVERWADAYYLNEIWVKEEVFSTCLFWLQPSIPRTWQFRGPDPALGGPPFPQIQIDEQWSGEDWHVVEKRLLAKIEDYESRIKEHQKLLHLFRGEEQRKKHIHFQWAALFQCRLMSPDKVADSTKCECDQSTVTKAIDSLFKIIRLKKRPARPGRRRKQNVKRFDLF